MAYSDLWVLQEKCGDNECCLKLFLNFLFGTAQLKGSINKGRFAFLKIDAANAVFLLWFTRNADLYLSQRDSLCVGSLRSGPWYLDQKKWSLRILSAVSLEAFHSLIISSLVDVLSASIPLANFLTSSAFCRS